MGFANIGEAFGRFGNGPAGSHKGGGGFANPAAGQFGAANGVDAYVNAFASGGKPAFPFMPPQAPDMTDAAVRAARKVKQIGAGRASTFLGGDVSAGATTTTPQQGGGPTTLASGLGKSFLGS